ncbi:hybrid sensor histidine kinase/response regulator [Aquibaculum arenosum]|uniref:histidine kinase n=1 Tax=Aquibaculum arenosum TaxID=3032591 RepID=A0ABT5YJ51_9PROT|nr:ATP-binding protein [Fodinicurvata sp. CAU 1616]MDF2094919.1 ATP-binding protein [Fodinicurvata sp. CAU 1616]
MPAAGGLFGGRLTTLLGGPNARLAAERDLLRAVLDADGWRHQVIAADGRVLLGSADSSSDMIPRDQALPDWLAARADDAAAQAALAELRRAAEAGESQDAVLTLRDGVRWQVRVRRLDGHGGACVWSLREAELQEPGSGQSDSGAGAAAPWQQLLDDLPVGVAQLDAQGNIQQCNATFLRLVGVAEDSARGSGLAALVEEARAGQLADMLAAMAKDPQAQPGLEMAMRHAPDTICSVNLRVLSQSSGGSLGASSGLVAYLQDRSAQKALEAQFVQSQKMQAVGQLAGGIAHDFNNLLTAMIGFADLLLLRHGPGDQSFGDIMQIKQNANRAANLVRQLLAFSRQQSLQPKVLNLTDILTEITHLLRRLIGKGIELKMRHGRDLGLVKADQGQLEQVIINLAINARDAMRTGGRLEIRTRNRELLEPLQRGGDTVPPGRYVMVEIEDSGQGIAPENLERVFEPFFSTKDVGEGTGLGLSTVYGIIKQTDGHVFIDSEVGHGTTVTLYLPQHEAEAQPEEKTTVRARDLSGQGRILLVEDEEAVRSFSARTLRNKGYEVLEAASGDQALEVIEGLDAATPLDLLITDVVMPRVDGPTLVGHARERLPDLKVIYISGYAEDSFRSKLGQDALISFLPKPFSLKQLAERVKEVMASDG